jgi:hypothetical protein
MSDLSDSLLLGAMIMPTGNVAKDVAIWQISVSCKSYVYTEINKCMGRLYFCDCLFPKKN